MKFSQKLVLSLSLMALAGIVGYIAIKNSKTRRVLGVISDEGYETAEDILFPGRTAKSKDVHYGPVIPR